MRVPDAFFMLHLLAAMVLLVDVLTALSNSTQTLQNKIRDAIDRRLWVQDSQVQTKVIGDEERVPSNSLLHVSLSSIPIERDAVLSRFPEICKTTTLVPPSQYSSIADYSNLLKQMEPELNMNQIQDLLKKFKDNTVSVVQRNQPNSPLPTNIDTSSPYVRSALYIAQKLTNFKKESVDFHLEGLIRYGFTRDEVEAILRTAGYGDLDEILTVFTLYLDIPSLPTEFRALLDYRAANIIVSRAKIGGSLFPLLKKWIKYSYTRDHVRLILRNVDLDAEKLQEVLSIHEKLDRIRIDLNEAPENKALDNSNAIIEDEINKARDIHAQASVDSRLTAAKWIQLFKRWIFLDFSREQIQSNFRCVITSDRRIWPISTESLGRIPGILRLINVQ
ncbi:hypothetical protein Plhal304r1_c036g0111321 [Plasmopara halstedii]